MLYRNDKEKFLCCLGFILFYFRNGMLQVSQPCNCFIEKTMYIDEYMDGWQKFNETSLQEKDDLYSHLNIGDITDANYTRTKSL